MNELIFGLKGTDRIELKSIYHDDIRITEVSVVQVMGINTVDKA